MISLKRLPILLGVVLMTASAAFAQTGTVTIQGQNPEAFSLTDNTGAALSSTIVLATLTPANNGTVISNTTTVRMRSNKAYTLSVQAAALGFTTLGAVDGGDTIALSDIGFGITTMTLTGNNVAHSPSRSESIAPGFDASSWPTSADGLTPSFGMTLANIATSATQILSGPRISKKGNLITADNFISVTFGAAVLPQFFTPNAQFSSIVTLTMASQ